MTKFRLHDEQKVNRSRKIAWAFVFHLKQQHIDTYVFTYIYTVYIFTYTYIYIRYMLSFQNKYIENCLFAANGKQKFVSFAGKR